MWRRGGWRKRTASSGRSSCFFAISNSFFLIWPSNCVKTISFCWSNTKSPLIFSIDAATKYFCNYFYHFSNLFCVWVFCSYVFVITLGYNCSIYQILRIDCEVFPLLFPPLQMECIDSSFCTQFSMVACVYVTDKCTWMPLAGIPLTAAMRTNTNTVHKWRRHAGIRCVRRIDFRSFDVKQKCIPSSLSSTRYNLNEDAHDLW